MGPRHVGGGTRRALEGFRELPSDDGPDPLPLPVGEGFPDVRAEKSRGNRVRVEQLFEGAGLAREERGGRPAPRLRSLLDSGRRGLREDSGRDYEERGGKRRGSRGRGRQAAIGSSRSTRGESDSAPRSVQRMSSSILTPNRPGR